MVFMSAHTRQICREDRANCTPVPYTTGDADKDAECRNECAKQRENLTEKITAYYCEEADQSCSSYEVYGRRRYGKIFDRHVMCVRACQLVGQVERSSNESLKVCRDIRKKCLTIEKKDGTFEAYRLCVPKCSGWTDLQKKIEHTAYICPKSGDCQEVKYLTTPEGRAFKRLKTCLEECLKE
nr:unnamed protein product [Spirometra erinaceieuropaei]